jgi:hypothetical protein
MAQVLPGQPPYRKNSPKILRVDGAYLIAWRTSSCARKVACVRRLSRRPSCRYGNPNNEVGKESLQCGHLSLVTVISFVRCMQIEVPLHVRIWGLCAFCQEIWRHQAHTFGTSETAIRRAHHRGTVIFGWHAILWSLLAYADPILVSRRARCTL